MQSQGAVGLPRQTGSVSPGQMLQSAVHSFRSCWCHYVPVSNHWALVRQFPGSVPPARRPTLFHCSILFLCELLPVVPLPTPSGGDLSRSNSNQ